jgi:hypothetical protein
MNFRRQIYEEFFILQNFFARPLGLEPRTTVLETVMLPLHYGRNCYPPGTRTPIKWTKTTCPAIRREGNNGDRNGFIRNLVGSYVSTSHTIRDLYLVCTLATMFSQLSILRLLYPL